MQKVTPFLWFDTQAEEAMNLYVSVFKNSKVLSVNRAGGRVVKPPGYVAWAGEGSLFTSRSHCGPKWERPRAGQGLPRSALTFLKHPRNPLTA